MAQCSDCNKRLKPMAIIQGERFYYECDWCLEEFCDNCCTVDEDTGLCKCNTCAEQEIIDVRNGREAKKPMVGV